MKSDIRKSSIVKVITISCSEMINDKFIYEYIMTNIEKSNIEEKNLQIFYSYLESSKEYAIFYYVSNEIYQFDFQYIRVNSLGYCLIYNEHLYYIFKDSKFYYYQKIPRNLLLDDLKLYVEKRFKIKISTILSFDEVHFEKKRLLKLNYLEKKFNYKRLVFFILILFLIILTLFFVEKSRVENRINYEIKKLQTIYKESNKKDITKNVSLSMEKIFLMFNKMNIGVNKISYKKNSFEFIVFSKDRSSFFELEKSLKRCSISSIEFNKEKSFYESKLFIKI